MMDMNFIDQCKTPGVSTATIAHIIRVESSGQENAIHANGDGAAIPIPKTREEATRLAKVLLQQGRSVDIGLMQLNTSNLKSLGLSIYKAFDPCINIRAGSTILKEAYERSSRTCGEGQEALKQALSIYNTGNKRKGFENGYVAKFYGKSRDDEPYTASTAVSLTSTQE